MKQLGSTKTDASLNFPVRKMAGVKWKFLQFSCQGAAPCQKLPHFQMLNTCGSWIRTNSLDTNTGIASLLGLGDLAKQLELI